MIRKSSFGNYINNKKSEGCYCFYAIPTFIFGVPLYNMSKCIIFVMEDLIAED